MLTSCKTPNKYSETDFCTCSLFQPVDVRRIKEHVTSAAQWLVEVQSIKTSAHEARFILYIKKHTYKLE